MLSTQAQSDAFYFLLSIFCEVVLFWMEKGFIEHQFSVSTEITYFAHRFNCAVRVNANVQDIRHQTGCLAWVNLDLMFFTIAINKKLTNTLEQYLNGCLSKAYHWHQYLDLDLKTTTLTIMFRPTVQLSTNHDTAL